MVIAEAMIAIKIWMYAIWGLSAFILWVFAYVRSI